MSDQPKMKFIIKPLKPYGARIFAFTIRNDYEFIISKFQINLIYYS